MKYQEHIYVYTLNLKTNFETIFDHNKNLSKYVLIF